MRILRIRLNNINSLRGEHTVHFDASPLREAGLFGIVGATGSGKSTLLDCITLALYGKVPRMGAVTKTSLDKGGVILTRHEKEALAEVVYSSKRGVFTAQWLVSKTRNNTFRDIEMKVFNEAGELLTEKASTAPEVNTENIGLDYDQFMKSILLSQGEFARFLQSDKNKRAELLEKITGTRLFRHLGIKAFKAFRKREEELNRKDELIRDIGKDLLDEESRATLHIEIQNITTSVTVLQGEWDKSRQLLDLKLRLVALQNKLSGIKQRIGEDETALQQFEQLSGEKLRHYNLLFPFREDLVEQERLKQQVEVGRLEVEGYENKIGSLDAGMAEMVQELSQWMGRTISTNEYVSALRIYRDEVRDLQQQSATAKQSLAERYSRITAVLQQPAFAKEKALFKPRESNVQWLMGLTQQIEEGQLRFDETLLQQGWKPDGLKTLSAQITSTLADLAQLKVEVRTYLQQHQQLKQSETKLQQWEAEYRKIDLDGLKKLLDDAEQSFNKARLEREQLLQAENLDTLRTQLKDGDPCPLCGATHHPYLHQFAQDLVKSVDAFESARKVLDQQQKTWKDAVLNESNLKAAVERERGIGEDLRKNLETVGESIGQFKARLRLDKVQTEEKVNELITNEQNKLRSLDECIQFEQWKPQAVQLHAEVLSYDQQFAAWAALQEQLKAKYTGADIEKDCKEREDRMQGMIRDRHTAAEQKIGVEIRVREQALQTQNLVTKLEDALKPLGFVNVEEARRSLISEQEQKQLVTRQQELLRELTARKAEWKGLQEQWEVESAGDDATVTVEAQQEEVGRLKVEVGSFRQQLEDKRAILIGDDQRKQQMSGYLLERKQLLEAIRPWEMLNKLIGDATGNKFNNKAQELTLQHLLILANQRMKHLHSRYVLLEPGGDDDLRVADGYMGGEVRTVRSLSGGETFVLSLALALGLSDLASRDIKIESLFVDEGFGSLDPETLEEAMSTLEQLQNESNKMVGIISHVESLKERIYTQIRLEKGNSGFSTLSIFPDPNEPNE
ncbi:MAG: AAA family ATPase [Chitinophagaceae bacterium]